ncbi:hypothetical protein H5410_064756 [Solanum commersonii]|uniref:Uncharacterized protein n=1 Tax=Solanum commersonii TaxID=4109 RepID=A0A9J5VYG0_SOLCO|nr:hypothetical protein H5410_064756 [Solanum commersonii]
MQARLIDLKPHQFVHHFEPRHFEHGTNTTTPPLFHMLTLTPQYFPPNPSLHKTNQALPNNPPTLNNPTFHKTIRNKPTLYPSLLHISPKLHLPKLGHRNQLHLPKLPAHPNNLTYPKYQATHIYGGTFAIPNVRYVPQELGGRPRLVHSETTKWNSWGAMAQNSWIGSSLTARQLGRGSLDEVGKKSIESLRRVCNALERNRIKFNLDGESEMTSLFIQSQM